ncbi:MAG: DUF5020 family protein [Bacteroidales bacterium]|nr:DUF5020 family protein [Bacteroidales bacterium]MBK9357759.1 DUF5020 family protein [Bacteroidales bacterium]
MKKITFLFLFSFSTFLLFSQNIQLHYDLGKDRNYLTSTVEFFKADKLGSTFFFVDMDYDVGEVKGISLAYWEIAREMNIGKSPLAAHIEYNGGFGRTTSSGYFGAYPINDAWLGGMAFNFNDKDFSKGLSFQLLYKYIREKHDASFQLTAVWYVNLLKNKVTFSGYADFWREDNVFYSNTGERTTKFVFQSEPQLWYNFTENISLGTELEVGYNFVPVRGSRANPTIGAKWTF